MKEFNIGDLVFLEDDTIVGIVLDVNKHSDEIVDVEVQWIDGERYWCLGEGLTLVPKKKIKKIPGKKS